VEPTFFHFTIGNLAELVTLIGAIVAAVFSVGRRVAVIEKAADDVRTDLGELRADVRKLGDLLTAIAVQSARLDMVDKRMDDIVSGRIRTNWHEVSK